MKGSLLLAVLCTVGTFMAHSQNVKTDWDEDLRAQQLSLIENPERWDMERMKNDMQPTPFGNPGFMQFGAFPVPDYALWGEDSFKGLGFASTAIQPLLWKGKKVIYSSFWVNDNRFYHSKNGKDRAFFTIITVTDTVDTVHYSTARVQILSRNHPDYLGQGYFKTKNQQIDFLGFTTPEGQEFAVVNMRLFHLQHGQVILIAPQKDGSLRSLQIKMPEIQSDQVDRIIQKELLTREEVVTFFTQPSVIK